MHHLADKELSRSHGHKKSYQTNQIYFRFNLCDLQLWVKVIADIANVRSQWTASLALTMYICRSNKWRDIAIIIFHMVIMEKWTLAYKLENVGQYDLIKTIPKAMDWRKVLMYHISSFSDFWLQNVPMLTDGQIWTKNHIVIPLLIKILQRSKKSRFYNIIFSIYNLWQY